MDKLLIVGIETLAGSNLALAFEGRFTVSGISRDGALQIDGIESSLVRRDDLAALERQVDALCAALDLALSAQRGSELGSRCDRDHRQRRIGRGLAADPLGQRA